ncbi:MAG: EAL domain-containing protein, partial [Hyphomicrobiales bacterium]
MALTPPNAGHRVSHQIVWTTIVLGACMALACGFSASWAAGRIDALAQAQQRAAVQAAMTQAMRLFGSDKDTTIISGQSVASLRNTEMDRSLTTELGHDRAYVLAPNGKVLRASADGRYAGFKFSDGDAAIVPPIVERLRLSIADIEFDDPALDWADTVGMSSVEAVSFGHGEVGFVGVRPIEPPEDATSYRNAGFLLVSIKLVSQPFLAEIGNNLGVNNLHRASRPVDNASVPLLDRRGNILGYLAWTPTLPARGLILEAAPALALLLAVGCALMGFLLAWLRRTSLSLEASQAHASYFALHDPLTGAANRTLFETRLQEAKAYRYLAETKVLLVAIDVDHFKEVNDTWGHAAGDELLKEVARRLRLEMPEEATVARLGGDEFAVIHPGIISDGQARWICHRLLQCARSPILISEERVQIGLSIGAALELGDTPPEEILRRADVALYAAKMAGRDRFALYDPAMDQEKRDRRKLEIELRNALLTGEGLHLVYQPILSAKTTEIVAAEALVRWTHPTRGMLAPDMFIGLAEECGIIDQLGSWVLREAIRFTVASGLPRVAVNFSPVQFRNEKLAEDILAVLNEEGLAADRLEVEITEGMLLQDSPQVQRSLQVLRAAGVSVALDDFGTGYASISYLRNYEVDKLKIDQSYTRLVLVDPAVAQIVRLVIGTAQALGMKITAEGVEDVQQQDVLTAMGCTYLQGYLFSRPVVADKLQT